MNLDRHRWALRSKRAVMPEGCGPATIVITRGKIESILPHDAPVQVPLTDVGDLVILPGLVDAHVHINDPDGGNRLAWEGFDSATRAAAAGGITTVIDMPLNCTPVTTNVAALERKRAAATGRLYVDVGCYGGLIRGSAAEVEPLVHAGVMGIKAFLVHSGIDDFPAAREQDLRAAMMVLAKHRVPLLAHAELIPEKDLLSSPAANPRCYADYARSRPAEWEVNAIQLLAKLAKETRCHVHIVHLATEDAIPIVAAERDYHVPITVETCPHYLYFTAETIADGATHFKCAPPIRGKETREALWDALRKGHIDMIASDHSPCPPAMKQTESGDFQKAWGGISSLQLMLSVVWTAGAPRGATFNNLAQWLSVFPAKLVGAESKGSIAPGKDADFVVFDPDATFTVDANKLHHRHKITPYDGETLHGVVRQTYLRGQIIYVDGAFPASNTGKPLPRSAHVLP